MNARLLFRSYPQVRNGASPQNNRCTGRMEQKPAMLIEKILTRAKTDGLAKTPDDLSTVIPHDHLAAGNIIPLSLPEQLDMIAMQYNQHLRWEQNPKAASSVIVRFAPLPSQAVPRKKNN